MTSSIETEFRRELGAAGLAPTDIIMDGKLHRCPTADKPHGKDGAYIAHVDEPASIWWQNWRTGQSGTWAAKTLNDLSPAAREALKNRIERDRKARLEEDARKYATAREKAGNILSSSKPAHADHPYLIRKGIHPPSGILALGNKLVIPVLDEKGKPQSVQFIGEDGGKRFLAGGRTAGGFFAIKYSDYGTGPLYIAEGFATAASVHLASGCTVLTAFNAGNLVPVAEMARRLYPEREIILCADDDLTEANTGLTKATEAARVVDGKLAVPVFLDHAGRSDFNDMHVEQGLDSVRRSLEAAKSTKPSKTVPPAGPGSFVTRPDGVYFLTEDSNGGITPEWVCSPLHIHAMTRDINDKNWGRLLELVDADGRSHRWAMPMEMLAGDGNDYRRELLSTGLRLASGQRSKNRLHDYLTVTNPKDRARCVSRVGWHGRRFVMPDAVYGPRDGEEIILQGGPSDHAFSMAGSLQEWQEALGLYCVGNSRLILGVSTALAAPLLALVGAESGGFHLHGGSSTGKTTALRVAGSVCGGGGIKGYSLQWRATTNGLESVAVAHTDSLLCLDEMGQADAKTAGETAYMLCNQGGKSRSRRDGTARKPQEWRLLFLSTGEITLADKVREDGRGRVMAGHQVRVVDILADAGAGLGLFENIHGFENTNAFARHLGESAARIYGSPLRAFLEKLTGQVEEAAKYVQAHVRAFVDASCSAGVDGQVERVAARFGLAAAAGELGIALGVLPWSKGEAHHGAARCFHDWLDARGGTGAAEVTAGLAQVRQFFQIHGSSRFETWGETADTSKVINRAGFRRKDAMSDEWSYYVFQDVFKLEVCQGHNVNMLLRELKARGLLLTQEAKGLTVKPRIPGVGNGTRFYHIAPTILGHEENTPELQKQVGTSRDSRDTLSCLGSERPYLENGHSGQSGQLDLLSGNVPTCPNPGNERSGQSQASKGEASLPVPTVPIQNDKRASESPTTIQCGHLELYHGEALVTPGSIDMEVDV